MIQPARPNLTKLTTTERFLIRPLFVFATGIEPMISSPKLNALRLGHVHEADTTTGFKFAYSQQE